ncbi:MAG: hypothetical protein J0I79_16600 [Mesorhizobium sp.]|uniref:hypothetical protein n=1 Tax=Mesorhizobium sp. TaxID=1871066 RepID=UPI001AD5E6B8|nr:hypothetical protein [Mesorhizobium sp.]MBN9219567.1 hypothetical protein [Mesorhizobium sp.]
MTEQVFTSEGRQRPTLNLKGKATSYAVAGAPEGSKLYWTDAEYVPANAPLAAQTAFAETFKPLGCLFGVITGATALRLNIAPGLAGYATLTTRPVEEETIASSIGAIARDMRVIAALV